MAKTERRYGAVASRDLRRRLAGSRTERAFSRADAKAGAAVQKVKRALEGAMTEAPAVSHPAKKSATAPPLGRRSAPKRDEYASLDVRGRKGTTHPTARGQRGRRAGSVSGAGMKGLDQQKAGKGRRLKSTKHKRPSFESYERKGGR